MSSSVGRVPGPEPVGRRFKSCLTDQFHGILTEEKVHLRRSAFPCPNDDLGCGADVPFEPNIAEGLSA